jgi:hypothetical protein
MRVFNATRHFQKRYKPQWDAWGITFVPTAGAQLGSVQVQADSKALLDEAMDAIEKAKYVNADAILIGGISGLAALIAVHARNHGLRVIEPQFSGRDRDDGNLNLLGYRDISTELDVLISYRDTNKEAAAG